MKHVIDDPRSACDCRECWYMRGFDAGLQRVCDALGIPIPSEVRTAAWANIGSVFKRIWGVWDRDAGKWVGSETTAGPIMFDSQLAAENAAADYRALRGHESEPARFEARPFNETASVPPDAPEPKEI